MEKISKRILVISYSYFPEPNPRAYRWTPILEYMSENGYKIDVICANHAQSKAVEEINGVNVYRVGKSVRSLLAGKNTELKDNGNTKTDSIKSKCIRLLKIIYDKTWKKLYWPDYTCLWFFYAYSKAKNLAKSNRYGAILSVSHPFNDHLVALKLKSKFPEFKWIIDIGDPFCFLTELPSNNYRLYSKLNYFFEKKVFIACDKVAVTTNETKEVYANLFPESKGKIAVIPPLVPAVSVIKEDNNRQRSDDKIKLVFVGTLYKNIRSPEFLLKLYSYMLNTEYFPLLELHFYGNMNGCTELFEPYRDYIGNKIFLHGHVGRDTVQLAINDATILVNIGNTTFYQLPSKVVEYVNTGKPIINISKIGNDSSSEFFKIYPRCLNLNEKENTELESMCSVIIEFIKNPPEELNQGEIEKILRPYQLNSIAEEYGKLLNEL